MSQTCRKTGLIKLCVQAKHPSARYTHRQVAEDYNASEMPECPAFLRRRKIHAVAEKLIEDKHEANHERRANLTSSAASRSPTLPDSQPSQPSATPIAKSSTATAVGVLKTLRMLLPLISSKNASNSSQICGEKIVRQSQDTEVAEIQVELDDILEASRVRQMRDIDDLQQLYHEAKNAGCVVETSPPPTKVWFQVVQRSLTLVRRLTPVTRLKKSTSSAPYRQESVDSCDSWI